MDEIPAADKKDFIKSQTIPPCILLKQKETFLDFICRFMINKNQKDKFWNKIHTRKKYKNSPRNVTLIY